jgi:hypothetical protein
VGSAYHVLRCETRCSELVRSALFRNVRCPSETRGQAKHFDARSLRRATPEPGPRWNPGVNFRAKSVLERAIVLLGASVSVVAALGPTLIFGIAGIVLTAIAAAALSL